MNLAVYVTGHGYGHLTRTCEVLRELRALRPDARLHLRAPYPRAKLVEALGFEPDSHSELRLDIGLVQHDALRMDLKASAEALERYFGPEGAPALEAEARWLRSTGITAALADIPPRAFEACALAGVPAYGLANFSWDWVWRSLSSEEPRLAPVAERAAQAYRSCRLLLRTVMAADLSAFARIEDIPLVARRSRREKGELRRLLGLEESEPVVLLSFGGEGLKGAVFPPRPVLERWRLLATEPMADPGAPVRYVSDAELARLGLRYCDLVRAADVVMTKPGYSIVAECAANGAAMLYSDRGPFPEYPILVDYLRHAMPSAHLPSEDLRAGRWAGALEALFERAPFRCTPPACDGAETAARRLAALAG